MKKITEKEKNKSKENELSVYIKKDFVPVSDTKLINVRIEKQLYDKFKNFAYSRDMTIKTLFIYSSLEKISEYNKDVYALLLNEKSVDKLIFQINKLGVNVNQIAKKINSGEVTGYNFNKFEEEINQIKLELKKFKSQIRKIK